MHTHDCETCHFLGRYTCDVYGECDLYYHDGTGKTLIARYGSAGPQYTSGICFVGMVPAITEANERALAAGFDVPQITAERRADNERALREYLAGKV